MNKHILTITLTGLALTGVSQIASAHEEDEVPAQQQGYQQSYDPRYADPRDDGHRQFDHRAGGGGLAYDVDHINRMLDHVQGQLQRYGADGHVRGEYQHLRSEFRQLNRQFRRGEQFYNRGRLRAEIEHMHGELHHIEQELRVPSYQWYQWR